MNEGKVIKQAEDYMSEEVSWMKLTCKQQVTPDDQLELRKWEDLELLSCKVLHNDWFWMDDLRSSCLCFRGDPL
jgi:hypothetical protein